MNNYKSETHNEWLGRDGKSVSQSLFYYVRNFKMYWKTVRGEEKESWAIPSNKEFLLRKLSVRLYEK